MSSILEYIDDTTKQVVSQIVSTYQEDILIYKDNFELQTIGIGTELNSILYSLCKCCLKQDELSKDFVLIISQDKPDFPTTKQNVCFSFNNALILRTRALQIINFLKRLSDEGLILFADAAENKSYPQYKGQAQEKERFEVCAVQNRRLNNFIKAIFYSHIFPTETLIGFVNNSFKTNEQVRYEHQKELSEKSLSEAIVANKISEKAVKIAKEANNLTEQSLSHAKKSSKISNRIAILVAFFAMAITIIVGLLPTSLSDSSIHEIGREIRISQPKETSPSILINNFQEIDSTKYGKAKNAKP